MKISKAFQRSSKVFLGSFKCVSGKRLFKECFTFKKVSKGPLRKLQRGLKERFKDVSRTFHRTLKYLSRVFQDKFSCVSKMFQALLRVF